MVQIVVNEHTIEDVRHMRDHGYQNERPEANIRKRTCFTGAAAFPGLHDGPHHEPRDVAAVQVVERARHEGGTHRNPYGVGDLGPPRPGQVRTIISVAAPHASLYARVRKP